MIEELKTFIEVVKYCNFTKAAKKVNLSQPTVSLHIKRLEAEFDAILVQRSNKNKEINITPEGKLLYEKGIEIIKQIEDIKSEISKTSSKERSILKIGASLTIGDHFLPGLVSGFTEEYPNIDIEVCIENTTHICKKVKGLEVDIGLIEGKADDYGARREKFYTDRMVLATANDSNINKDEFTIQDLNNQVWISREEGSGTREYLNAFLKENSIKPRNIFVFSSNYAVKEAVQRGLGITLISEYVVAHAAFDKELAILPLPTNQTRNFSYILPIHKENSQALNQFIEMLKHYVNKSYKEVNEITGERK